MPCVTDLSQVSTNSLPSTLLKKTNGRKQVPFYDRIVPSAVLKPQQRNDTDDDDNDGELSSVSTQSNPLSRSQPSRGHFHRASTTSTKMTSEISFEGSRDRPIIAADQFRNDNNMNNKQNQRPRRPSPERTMSYQNTTTRSLPPTKLNTATSKSRPDKDRDDFEDFLNCRDTNTSSPVDFNEAVLQHPSMKKLSVSDHDSKNMNTNNTKESHNSNNYNSTILRNATDVSEVLGRTIPFSGSSVNVLSSKDDDDDDDRHRYVVTITTSRSTIKASGGRSRYPRMDDYVAAVSPLRPMKSYSFSNYSTQFEEDDEVEEFDDSPKNIDFLDTSNKQEIKAVLHESNHAYDHAATNIVQSVSAKFQKERDNDIISAANSRRSGKLSVVASEASRNNKIISSIPSESYGRNEHNTNLTGITTASVGSHRHDQQASLSKASRTSSFNRRNSPSTEQLPADDKINEVLQLGQQDLEKNDVPESLMKDEASQSKTLSSTRFLTNDIRNHDNDDIIEAQRENEILSAAASRKSGKTGATGIRTHTSTSNRSREVLIEDHEKPTNGESGATAWKKIDDVLFGDDQSELHLFKKPTKDVAFDDLLTTTSDCSSISVSLDPSGCVVNESNVISSKRQDHVTNVITDVEFNRVKTVLDRMRKPMLVHTGTSTNNTNSTFHRGGVGMAAINAPKMKNRIGTGNFVQSRFKNTPQISIVRAAKQLEESRKALVLRPKFSETRESLDIPIIVQASSFHGEVSDQNVVESVQVLTSPMKNQTLAKAMGVQQNALRLQASTTTGSSGRKDPPANTLCSEKR